MRTARGFTLLEVLVALAVVAIALTAVLANSGTTVSQAAQLRDTSIAQWVAENRIAELRLEGAWPSTGRTEGNEDMAGREWHWTMEVENTQDDDLRRIQVRVRTDRDAEGSVATVLGFIGRPQEIQGIPRFIPSVPPDPDYDPDEDNGGGTPPPPPTGGRSR
ncbi:type II secretion system minor pseudopilin GspI [Gammaproteobacteria bacterium AB-CW1]|uniref:Type II secretion system protein I n=1 Tax=Natronospira elongata TaxID=3110268 RepID=A0AAP6JEZ2_9GAMM|nr:type II secretion system minor pseudopilin GspI [Gammaproteobacteria bacterium AB-CW1]